MPQADVVNAFTKGRNQSNFAVLLSEKLFDEKTRVKCNVRGRKRRSWILQSSIRVCKFF